MKPLKRISLLCAALLLLAIPAMGNATGVDTTTTTAAITFQEGSLRFADTAMEFAFGTHKMQYYKATYYDTVNGPHSLTVNDTRATPDGWKVTALYSPSLTSGGATNVTSALYLYRGTCENSNVAVIQSITLTNASVQVASATSAAGRGLFELVWNDDDQVQLYINSAQSRYLVAAAYTATVTWMLTAGP